MLHTDFLMKKYGGFIGKYGLFLEDFPWFYGFSGVFSFYFLFFDQTRVSLPLQLSSASANTITDKIHLAHLQISENDKHMLGVKKTENESTTNSD